MDHSAAKIKHPHVHVHVHACTCTMKFSVFPRVVSLCPEDEHLVKIQYRYQLHSLSYMYNYIRSLAD